jgi:hypothetical protein
MGTAISLLFIVSLAVAVGLGGFGLVMEHPVGVLAWSS